MICATRSAADWYASLPAPAAVSLLPGEASIRRYADTPEEIDQPALRQDIVCLHLGGAKQVRRWSGREVSDHDVGQGAVTIMPAGAANRWRTRGPIDYAHLVLGQGLMRQVGLEEFDRAPEVELHGLVGVRDDLLEQLFRRLLAVQGRSRSGGRLYLESLLVVLTAHLIGQYSSLRPASAVTCAKTGRKGGLAPWRLRQVLDHMQAALAADISLEELAALSGLSRAQFFRAFKQSTSSTPSRYLSQMRLERAAEMLEQTALDAGEISAAVGLGEQFAARFRRRYGVSPELYRLSRR